MFYVFDNSGELRLRTVSKPFGTRDLCGVTLPADRLPNHHKDVSVVCTELRVSLFPEDGSRNWLGVVAVQPIRSADIPATIPPFERPLHVRPWGPTGLEYAGQTTI